MAHAAAEVDNQNTNEHILEYLRYYCDENNTFDFAVMLKGRWGAGKTYLIKSFLEARPTTPIGKERPLCEPLWTNINSRDR
jgi:tRNA A37 threonylcarbamoyladenosine biosynthesis protein TsaE